MYFFFSNVQVWNILCQNAICKLHKHEGACHRLKNFAHKKQEKRRAAATKGISRPPCTLDPRLRAGVGHLEDRVSKVERELQKPPPPTLLSIVGIIYVRYTLVIFAAILCAQFSYWIFWTWLPTFPVKTGGFTPLRLHRVDDRDPGRGLGWLRHQRNRRTACEAIIITLLLLIATVSSFMYLTAPFCSVSSLATGQATATSSPKTSPPGAGAPAPGSPTIWP